MQVMKKNFRFVVAALFASLILIMCGCGSSSSTDSNPPTQTQAPQQTNTISDPVTSAVVGSHQTYNVGPGQTFAEPDSVPWGALVAGDVVNIFYRETPYRWKIGLRGQGTAQNPIVINGVTDSVGHRPQFDFNGARTASGSNPGSGQNVFTTTPE
jgi:hypothetical protein